MLVAAWWYAGCMSILDEIVANRRAFKRAKREMYKVLDARNDLLNAALDEGVSFKEIAEATGQSELIIEVMVKNGTIGNHEQ